MAPPPSRAFAASAALDKIELERPGAQWAGEAAFLPDSTYDPPPAGPLEFRQPPMGPEGSALAKSLDPVYKLHVRTSRNNTHIMLTDNFGKIPKDAWFSAGSIGLKRGQRATYEAGYRCAVRMFRRIEEEMQRFVDTQQRMQLVVCFSGFGQGREAVARALSSAEGQVTAKIVTKLQDTTPIKVGGTRSKKTRRF